MTGARKHDRDTTQRHFHTFLYAESSQGLRGMSRDDAYIMLIYITPVDEMDVVSGIENDKKWEM